MVEFLDWTVRLPVMQERPKKRGDCVDGPRPCPWVSCKYHLLTKWVHLMEPEQAANVIVAAEETCELDAYEREHTHREIAEAMGVSRERVVFLEQRAIRKARKG